MNPFPRATTYNKGRVPLIYPLWGCTRVLILLGPETEVKRITSEIKTQSRRANFVSTEQEVRENQIKYIFKRVIFFKIPSILKSAASRIFEPCCSETFTLESDVKLPEKLLHEYEVETKTSFVMCYSYSVG